MNDPPNVPHPLAPPRLRRPAAPPRAAM